MSNYEESERERLRREAREAIDGGSRSCSMCVLFVAVFLFVRVVLIGLLSR